MNPASSDVLPDKNCPVGQDFIAPNDSALIAWPIDVTTISQCLSINALFAR